MTLRNPIEVYRSHVYRYKWLPEQFIVYLVDAFNLMDELAYKHDAFVFKVDRINQKAEVNRLAEWLDIDDYKYRRVPVNTNGTRGIGQCVNPQLFCKAPPTEILQLANRYGY
jgi:hypothetical protein